MTDDLTIGYWRYRRIDGVWEGTCTDAPSFADDQWWTAPEPHLLDRITELAELLHNLTCPNCHDRHCMNCIMRYIHDTCVDDCPQCCTDQPGLHLSEPVDAWRARKTWLDTHA